MNYRKFGRTDWLVSEIGYGMWGMSGDWLGGDDAQSRASLNLAVELGCTFFDTAWVYGKGKSERLLGELIRNHPELTDAAISKLLGTTKSTVQAIRERTHWNAANLRLIDPVSLSLCTQIDLDAAVQKAASRRPRVEVAEDTTTLLPTSETVDNNDLTAEEEARTVNIADPNKIFNLPND